MPRQNASSSPLRQTDDSESVWPAWMLWIARRLYRRNKTSHTTDLATNATPGAKDQRNIPNDTGQPARHFSESLESRQMLSAASSVVNFLPVTFIQNARAQTLAVGDFNNDGKPDLVATDEPDSDVAVLLNAGNGTFLPPEHYFAINARSVAVADFNGDGNQDLAVLSPNGIDSQIDLYYGNGDGTFQKPSVKIDIPFGSTAIAAADMNGDGRPDLIITTIQRVIVLLNEGGGAFSKPVNYAGGPGTSGELVIGDFNNDGKQDIAMVRRGSAGISVLFGNGDGTLGPPQFIRTGTSPRAIAAGDFNGDGNLDLAVSNSDFRASALDILIGNGDGSFSQSKPYAGGNFVDGVVTGDFNGDGRTDVATVSYTSDTRVYAGNGDGTFQPFRAFPGAQFGQYVVAADFNGDGLDDLAIATGIGIKILPATNGSALPPPTTSPSLNVTIGGGLKSVTYKDISGSTVTLSLTGPGSATIDLTGANLSTDSTGEHVVGGSATLTSITATGTTGATTLSITPSGKNGQVNVGSISTDGSFGAVVAPLANLVGNLSIPGGVGTVEIDNASNGAITLGSGNSPVNLYFRNVTDESLTSTQPIANLSAGQWISTAAGLSQISAPSLGNVKIVAEFSADVTTTAAIGVANFLARNLGGGTWNLSGGAAKIIRTRLGAQFAISAGSINLLQVKNSLFDSAITTTGKIGTISAGTLVNSTINAGTALTAGNPNQPSLGSITLRPHPFVPPPGSPTLPPPSPLASFANSTITAPTIGRLNLGAIEFDNGGIPEGITTGSIALLAGSDLTTKKSFALVDPVSLEALVARGIDTGDFVLDIT